MKTNLKAALSVVVLTLAFFQTPAKAFDMMEVTGQFTSAIGSNGQNFKPGLGASAAVYFDRMLDPAIPNFFSVGYNSFTLKADDSSSFRLIPILVGIELNGKVFSDFNTTFAIGMGGAIGFISSSGVGSNMNMAGYFVTQVKPGFQWWIDPSFAIVARSPITFLIGKKAMPYAAADIGVQFKL